MKRLFVDTAGWMAMADSKDPLFTQARNLRDQWLKDGGLLATSNFVTDETLTLIRMRLGLGAAETWWNMVSASARISVEWIEPERFEKAANWFFRWKEHRFSFTDCTSFVVMKEIKIQKVLTADAHFSLAGFEVVPKAMG